MQNYTFDPMGNRTNLNGEQYTYNNANMLLTKGAQQYTNDANGNTLTGGGRTNTWDSENRLAQCVYNGTTSTFSYGPDGLRRRSVVGGVTTDYVLDGQSVVRERRGGTNYATYLTGPSGPMYRRDASGNVSWYVYDGLGSVVAEIGSPDQNNNPVKAARKYDVYGYVRSGDAGTSSNKFCGQLGHASEDNTGLIYMRARYMDPALGRFVSEDPSLKGSNWYTYCQGNPVGVCDYSGKDAVDVAGLYSLGVGFTILALCATWSAEPALAVTMAAFAVYCYQMSSLCMDHEIPKWKQFAGDTMDLIVGANFVGIISSLVASVRIGNGFSELTGSEAVAWPAVAAAFGYSLLLLGEM